MKKSVYVCLILSLSLALAFTNVAFAKGGKADTAGEPEYAGNVVKICHFPGHETIATVDAGPFIIGDIVYDWVMDPTWEGLTCLDLGGKILEVGVKACEKGHAAAIDFAGTCLENAYPDPGDSDDVDDSDEPVEE